ncbi:MAG TPA: hypothetical protein VFD80_05645 [Flavobacteriaceae bacterium]|nr:hypothetical protein [Flavobacteriaceae bacterium]
MKNLVTLYILILFSVPAKAEYESYQITLTIEKKNGQKYEGYVHIPTVYLKIDSIQNPAYLKRALNWHNGWENEDYLTYFKERLKYEYKYAPVKTEQLRLISHAYYLTNKTKIPLDSIKSITVDDIFDWNYAANILVLDESPDLTWLKSEPITTYFVSSLMCEEIQIFVHQKNDTIDKLINKFTEVLKEKDDVETNEKNLNYGDIIYYNELSDELNNFYETMKGYKVVIVSFCLR